jgi:uncharacterized protein (TIGR03118 family)
MQGFALRRLVGGVATAGAVLVAVGVGAPAQAAPPDRFNVVPLVSDQPGRAPLVDANVVNAWGLALSPTGPLWVANNGTNTATVYAGGVNGATPTKVPLTVDVATEGPTGQVFNDTAGFVIPGSTKALFIFDSEEGDITAWNGSLGATAKVVAHVAGAIYKGLAILHAGTTAYLLAADFHNARIDVFDSAFHRMPGLSARFTDPALPKGFAPFNVFAVGSTVYVTYAMQDEQAEDEVAGRGLGFVNSFDGVTGNVARIAGRDTLNAPWGLAIAPASFGRFAGALLVGNFGDGRIGAYRDGRSLGLLRMRRGGAVRIQGLWALQPGTATTGGAGTLWFSAGPDDETHGLVGQILPAT